MKVLLAAFACHPLRGSESYVGWTALNAIASRHDVWLIGHGDSTEAIRPLLPDLPNGHRIHLHGIGGALSWHPNRLIARFQDWMRYWNWCRAARQLAIDLHRAHRFDVAHHLTLATWRIPSPLAGTGIPWLWGPIGGGESFPNRFLPILAPATRAFELLRTASSAAAAASPALRRCARDCAFAFANNRETAGVIARLGTPPDRVGSLSQSFFPASRLEFFRPIQPKPDPAAELRIFAGGNLEGRKGIAIALRALRLLADSGIPFRFRYGGQGPEFAHLARLATRLRLGPPSVSLGEILAGEAYRDALRDSHVYLLPSLREGAPVTMIEAMAAGCVPVVAHCGGAAILVDEECGSSIPVTDPDTMARDIADSLRDLASNPDRLATLSSAAQQRVAQRCSESNYIDTIEAAYRRIAGVA